MNWRVHDDFVRKASNNWVWTLLMLGAHIRGPAAVPDMVATVERARLKAGLEIEVFKNSWGIA